MHSDLLLLKHKNPNRSQQAPPGWFSQVNSFFPALLIENTSLPWERHLLQRQQAWLLSFQVGDLGQVTYASTALALGPNTEGNTLQQLFKQERDHNLRRHKNDGGKQQAPCLLHVKSQRVLETASSGRNGCRGLEEVKS